MADLTIFKRYQVTLIDLDGSIGRIEVIAKTNAAACAIARVTRPGDYIRVSAFSIALADRPPRDSLASATFALGAL